jgi:hypothetical protein
MNSLYKSYLITALIALLICIGSMVSNVSGFLAETDSLNAYVEDNGTTDGFRLDKFKYYMRYVDEEAETTPYPNFDSVGTMCRDNTGDGLWYVALAILTALFYLHEKSSSTADFCVVLPIKKRNTFAFKFGLLALIAVAMLAVNVWSIYMYNARVPACNETYSDLRTRMYR